MPSGSDELDRKRKRESQEKHRVNSKRVRAAGNGTAGTSSNEAKEKPAHPTTSVSNSSNTRGSSNKDRKHILNPQRVQKDDGKEYQPTCDQENQTSQDAPAESVDEHALQPSSSKENKRKQKKNKLAQQSVHAQIQANGGPQNAGVVENTQLWSISAPVGGTFINNKPLFSSDEKFIICATQHAVNVYSAADSLLVHSLPCSSGQSITCFTLSEEDPNVLYVGTKSGLISKWDWRKAQRLGRWKTGNTIIGIDSTILRSTQRETIFCLDKTKEFRITAHELGDKDSPSRTAVQTILKTSKSVRSISAVAAGQVIVLITSDSIMCGQIASTANASVNEVEYTWNEVLCNQAPLCFDVRIRRSGNPYSTTRTTPERENLVSGAEPTLDIVVGCIKGQIFLYKDFLQGIQMAISSKRPPPKHNAVSLSAHEFHWHREAVGTVAWSLDGNYIISGGRETVLVLWQLETGKQQLLPHLGSPIENMTVSPSGSSYCVQLSDNSVMVLSTSELSPTANVTGLQSFSFMDSSSSQPVIPTVELLDSLNRDISLEGVRSLMSPHAPNVLLAAVPAHQAKSDPLMKSLSTPYLQAFDIFNSRSISRQALARTNATNVNLGPEGNRIQEPNISHLQVTFDGSWLVTVNEWIPPQENFRDITLGTTDERGELARHREIQLKFWRWDAEQTSWAMNSRVDMPHVFDNTRVSGRILDVKAKPTETEVATVGEDGKVRFWVPRKRIKNGKVLREKGTSKVNDTNESTWWDVRTTTSFEKSVRDDPLSLLWPVRAQIAYSEDGSVLAVTHQFDDENHEDHGLVHFVDTTDGTVRQTIPDMCTNVGKTIDMDFLGRYLIILGSQGTSVWDVTCLSNLGFISFRPDTSEMPNDNALAVSPQMAVNNTAKTFAITNPEIRRSQNRVVHPIHDCLGNVRVYSLASGLHCLYETSLNSPALSLLPESFKDGALRKDNQFPLESDGHGFVVLDSQAAVRTIRPHSQISGRWKQTVTSIDANGIKKKKKKKNQNANGLAREQNGFAENQANQEPETDNDDVSRVRDLFSNAAMDEDNAPVVRPESIAEIFDYPSHAMPPVKDLFANILKLYAGDN